MAADALAAAGGEAAEFVELGVDAFADGSTVAESYGRFVDEGTGDDLVQVVEGVEGGGEFGPAIGDCWLLVVGCRLLGCQGGGGGAEVGEAGDGRAEGYYLAGACGLHCYAAEEAFEVEDAVHGAAEGFAAADVGGGFGYGVEPRVDGGDGLHGAEKLGAEQALAHRGAAGVEGPEEGGLGAFGGEEGLDELEVADADSVELEAVAALVVAEGVEVVECALLGGAEVVDDGSGGDGGGGVVGEAHAVEGVDAELLAKEREGIVLSEGPVFDFGAGTGDVELGWLFFFCDVAEDALADALGGGAEACAARPRTLGIDDFGGAHSG